MMISLKFNLLVKTGILLLVFSFSALIPNYGHAYYGGWGGGLYALGGLYGGYGLGGLMGGYGGLMGGYGRGLYGGMMGGMYGGMMGGLYGMMGGMYGLGGYGGTNYLGQLASYAAYMIPYTYGYESLGSSLLPGLSGWQGVYGPGVSYYN